MKKVKKPKAGEKKKGKSRRKYYLESSKYEGQKRGFERIYISAPHIGWFAIYKEEK